MEALTREKVMAYKAAIKELTTRASFDSWRIKDGKFTVIPLENDSRRMQCIMLADYFKGLLAADEALNIGMPARANRLAYQAIKLFKTVQEIQKGE